MVQDSYYSLRDVVETRSYTTPVPAEEEKEEDNDNADENSGGAAENQVEVWREQSNDTAMWLYDLVFSTAVEASRDTESTKTSDSPSPEALPHGQLLKEPSEASNTTLLALCQNTSMQQLQAMAQQPPPVKSVVSELLSEWTTLTEDEIEGTTAERKGKDSMAGIDRSNESGVIEDMVTFEDPKGRKFVFPFEVAKEWSVSIVPHQSIGRHGVEGNLLISKQPREWKDTSRKRLKTPIYLYRTFIMVTTISSTHKEQLFFRQCGNISSVQVSLSR